MAIITIGKIDRGKHEAKEWQEKNRNDKQMKNMNTDEVQLHADGKMAWRMGQINERNEEKSLVGNSFLLLRSIQSKSKRKNFNI